MSKRMTIEQRVANLETAISRFYMSYDVSPNNPVAQRLRAVERELAELKRAAAPPVSGTRTAPVAEPEREAA
ncbi:MAG TPA: hypothetical protein VF814_21780 [Casimicrobiaceae bacterium]